MAEKLIPLSLIFVKIGTAKHALLYLLFKFAGKLFKFNFNGS